MRRRFLYKLFNCYLFDKKNSPFIIGICIGIALSLIQTPFVQKECSKKSINHGSAEKLSISHRDLQESIGHKEDPNDDYEPFIKFDKNEEVVKETDDKKSKLVRPRYYSTELGMRNKLLVSIISSHDTIKTFGIAINKTLNHFVDKLIFFIDGTGENKYGLNIPIVGFKSAKPLIKWFRVMSYIKENYLADFDYFFFATDHTYINGKRLMHMLEHISINNDIHMGSPITKEDSFYCSLENGILLSHSVFESVAKQLTWCSRNTFSSDDTDNLGRCILHSANLPCQASFRNYCFASYSLHGVDNVQEYIEESEEDSVTKKAVTVSNVEKPSDLYRLHVFYLKEFVIETRNEIVEIRKNIERTIKLSPMNISLPWPIGSPPPHVPTSRHDIITWETFNATHMFMPNDFTNVELLTGIDLMDIMNVVNSSVAHLKTKYPTLNFDKIRYGHRRYDPTRGMDYLISLNFKDEHGAHINKKIEAYRGLTTPEILPMPYVTETTKLTFILFIEKANVGEVKGFFDRLEQKVKLSHFTLLIVCLYDSKVDPNESDAFASVKETVDKFSKANYNSQSRASILPLKFQTNRPSEIALLDVALRELPGDSLVYFVEINSFFDNSFVNRVRMNTIKNKQMFSPIPFILYHPNAVSNSASYAKKQVSSANGHFDLYYFSQGSFYVEDYVAARLELSSVAPFKSEKDFERDDEISRELNLFDIFEADNRLQILRGVEPNLILNYKEVKCPHVTGVKSAKQQECETRQSLSIGSKQMLSQFVFEHQQKEQKIIDDAKAVKKNN